MVYRAERQRLIMEKIEQNGSLSVRELAKYFGVTEVTIRKDLNQLTEEGLVDRAHGGAIAKNDTPWAFGFLTRQRKQSEEKEKIGRFCSGLISEGQLVILDSGTTALMVAKEISSKRVTVITNNIFIGMELVRWRKVAVILTGGVFHDLKIPLTGEISISVLKQEKKIDICFISCVGIDSNGVVYNDYLPEVEAKKEMIKKAKQKILIADSSKFGKQGRFPFSKLDDFDKVITGKRTKGNNLTKLVGKNKTKIIEL